MNGSVDMYSLNKQIISQFPLFNEENWEGAEKKFNDWLETQNDKFYMLYGREINYFTLFSKIKNGEFKNLFSALKACLESVGPIYAIDVMEDNSAVEIWAQIGEQQATCLYLFPYDDGVVYYE